MKLSLVQYIALSLSATLSATTATLAQIRPMPIPIPNRNLNLPNLRNSLSEDCIRFNPDNVSVAQRQGRWKVIDGNQWLFDFGNDRGEAEEALRIIQAYDMDSSCFVGRPDPSFEYLLSAGNAPVGSLADEDCLAFNPDRVSVIEANGRWKIASGNRWLFDFGNEEGEARQALTVIQNYDFNQSCYVGRPNPDFQYLVQGGEELDTSDRAEDSGEMDVLLELSQFKAHNADEDNFYSNGDEPYLFVVAIYMDGDTIEIGDLPNSTVQLESANRTHGNLGRSGVDGGDRFAIPSSTGRFTTTLNPILPGELGRENTLMGVVVIAMEEDATPTSAANAARRALVNGLQRELDNTVQSINLADAIAGETPTPDFEELKAKLSSEMRDAIKKESLASISGLFSLADPDDYIGADFALWSYQDIANANSAGIPIQMNFRKSGVHYEVTGRVRQD